LHPLSANVEITIFETNIFVDIVTALINWKRRWFGVVQDFDRAICQFDFAGWDIFIDRALWACLYRASNSDHPLGSNVNRIVNYTLNYATEVAQV
jgi:hypothetical protein